MKPNKTLRNDFSNASLLQDSIKKRLISDVPIGTFLSGGTDSSIVTAIAQEINETPIDETIVVD